MINARRDGGRHLHGTFEPRRRGGRPAAADALNDSGAVRNHRIGPLSVILLTFFLEGAARKWFVPGSLQIVVYFAKDVAVGIVLWQARSALHRAATTSLGFFILLYLVFAVWGYGQLVDGRVSFPVLFAGIHGYLAFPTYALAVFCAMRVTTAHQLRRDLQTLTALISVQLIIIIIQGASPKTSLWNKVLAQDGLDVFSLAGNIVRATGFFTSPAGLSAALVMSSAVAFWALWWFNVNELDSRAPQILVLVCGLSMVLSGSRTSVVFAVLLVLIALVPPASMRGHRRNLVARSSAVLGVVSIVALVAFGTYTRALGTRFVTASGQEDPYTRIASTFTVWIHQLGRVSWGGDGMGTAGHAGVAIQAATQADWIEDDLARTVHELGWVLGSVTVLIRLAFAIWVAVNAAKRWSGGDQGGTFLAIAAFPSISSGSITAQGDVTLACAILTGIFLAMGPGQLAQPLSRNTAPSERNSLAYRTVEDANSSNN